MTRRPRQASQISESRTGDERLAEASTKSTWWENKSGTTPLAVRRGVPGVGPLNIGVLGNPYTKRQFKQKKGLSRPLDQFTQVADEEVKKSLAAPSGFMNAVFTAWHASEQQDLTTTCN